MTARLDQLQTWLGVDAGGTRTIALAIGADGRELARFESGPGNPLAVGDEHAVTSLREAVDGVMARLDPSRPLAAHFGMAGSGRPRDARRARTLIDRLALDCPVGVSDDAAISFHAGAEPPGVVLVAGTGAIAVAYDREGAAFRSGGHGYLVGDEGSAYWIGREAVRAALRAADGRAAPTILGTVVTEHLRTTSLDDIVTELYGGGLSRAAIAGLAPDVVTADDEAAHAITVAALDELAALVSACRRRASIGDVAIPLVIAGGLLLHNDDFRRRLEARLARADDRIRPLQLRASPAMGAARLAARLSR